MAQGPVAVIDTNVIILMIADRRSEDQKTRTRRECLELTIEGLMKQKARFVVPAPVVAELCRDGPGSELLRKKVSAALARTRVEPLDTVAADIAGEMSIAALKGRAAGRERGAIKYDALIAAIAHRIGARWLVTDDSKRNSIARCLQIVGSTVEVLEATSAPKHGQLHLIHAQAARGSAEDE